MTSEQIYEQFIIKINKNAQTDFVHCDRGRFVVLYNEAQIKYEESILQKRNEDEIRYAQQFVVPNFSLSVETSEDNYSTFILPENYFDFISLKGKASTSYCQNATISLHETKLENIEILLDDEHNKPSFDYREAPFKIGNGTIIAYKENFTYDSVLFTYYRYPQEIQLVDPEDPESQFDETKQSEWDDKSNNRIIDSAAARFFLNNDDAKYQPTKMESIQK